MGNSYVLNNELLSWSDQNALCSFRYGTSLASIHSVNDNSLVDEMCPGQCWIGLNDIAVEGNFEWIDGTSFDFGNETDKNIDDDIWDDSQPNDYQNQDCVKIHTDGKWGDDGCSDSFHRGICRYPELRYIVLDGADTIRSPVNSQIIATIDILDEIYIEFTVSINSLSTQESNILMIGNSENEIFSSISISDNSLRCGYFPYTCMEDLNWAETYGKNTNPEYYPNFEQITRIPLEQATAEDMQLYFACRGVTLDGCDGMQAPCERTCNGISPTKAPTSSSSLKSYFRFSQSYLSHVGEYGKWETIEQNVDYKISYHLQQNNLSITVNGVQVIPGNTYINSHRIQENVNIYLSSPYMPPADVTINNLIMYTANARRPDNEFNYLCDFNNRFTVSESNIFKFNKARFGCVVDCTSNYGYYEPNAWMGDADKSSLHWTDYKIESRIYYNNGEEFFCIAFRMQDMNGNEYRYCLYPIDEGGVIRMRKVVNGQKTTIFKQSATIYGNAEHTLRVEVNKNVFTMYFNNGRIGHVTDDSFAFGSIGLRYKKATIRFNTLRIMFPNENKLHTINPTISPTADPIATKDPTFDPTINPTSIPTFSPTSIPTELPITDSPTTATPSTSVPTSNTSKMPTLVPSTAKPVSNFPSVETLSPAPGASSSTTQPSSDTLAEGNVQDPANGIAATELLNENGKIKTQTSDMMMQIIYFALGFIAICCIVVTCLLICKCKRTRKRNRFEEASKAIKTTDTMEMAGDINSVSIVEGPIVSDFETGLKTNMVAENIMMDDVVEMMNVTPMDPKQSVMEIDMTESDDDVVSDDMQPMQIFQALPKSISDVKLEFHQTARLTLDENGVKDMLNVDDFAEMEEYEEGNVGDNDMIIIGDDETTKGVHVYDDEADDDDDVLKGINTLK